jgi:hypothetical protein
MEALPPVLLFLSILGLGIAWRWERMGGTISVAFLLATLAALLVHDANAKEFPRSAIPYLMTLIVAIPAILFLATSWRSGRRSVSSDNS